MAAILRSVFLLTATMAAAAGAAPPPATARVVACGQTDCVLVRGRRASPDASVAINGRPVAATGGRTWQVRLPIETIRDWSAPFARTLDISVSNPARPAVAHDEVRLPVGLLARRIELASLVVHAR